METYQMYVASSDSLFLFYVNYLHLVFVPLTKDNRLCAKEIIGNRANLTKWHH